LTTMLLFVSVLAHERAGDQQVQLHSKLSQSARNLTHTVAAFGRKGSSLVGEVVLQSELLS